MGPVRGLGYVVVHATDLAAWDRFAVGLLGLQAAERTGERLLLRADEKSWRLDIRRAAVDGVAAVGWETAGPAELDALTALLEKEGYETERGSGAECRERMVSGLVRITDPEGVPLELFYGMKKDRERFVSPTGARFVTGEGGLGHIFQIVRDNEPYRRLYCGLFGFRLSDHVDFAPDRYGTFLHCGPRHHSMAYAPIPQAKAGVGHLMLEVDDLDLVGRAWDRVLDGAAPVASTLGKHSNDEMVSFYVNSPAGFQIEYGWGGRVIDPDTWTPSRFDTSNYWGHKRSDPGEPDV